MATAKAEKPCGKGPSHSSRKGCSSAEVSRSSLQPLDKSSASGRGVQCHLDRNDPNFAKVSVSSLLCELFPTQHNECYNQEGWLQAAAVSDASLQGSKNTLTVTQLALVHSSADNAVQACDICYAEQLTEPCQSTPAAQRWPLAPLQAGSVPDTAPMLNVDRQGNSC